MTTPLQVALVGYGLAGRVFHAPLIRAAEGLLLTTVVSSDPTKVRADLADVAVVPDLDAALRDPAIKLVVIATPDHCHADHALAALAAGKHVVIDKPLAPSLAEARVVADAAHAAGRIMAVFHNRRWDADFLTLRRLIDEGELGEIVQFESHFDRFRPVGSRWKDRRAGGVWQDLGPHLIDQALTLFGMPEAVFADLAAQRAGSEAPDYAHVLLRYPTRRVILHASQSVHDAGLRFAVHGTLGSFVKHGLDPQEEQSGRGLAPGDPAWGLDPQPGLLTRAIDGEGETRRIIGARGDYNQFYARLTAAIRENDANPVPPQQALDVMVILEACLESARTRSEVLVAG